MTPAAGGGMGDRGAQPQGSKASFTHSGLLDQITRAEVRVQGLREEAGAASVDRGDPWPLDFEDYLTSAGAMLATHYALSVLQLARHALTDHTAGSLEPHLLGLAESITRSVLHEPHPSVVSFARAAARKGITS